MRRSSIDCSQSWIIPNSNRTPGRYILHGALLQDTRKARLHLESPPANDLIVAQHLDNLSITYRQRAYRTEPAFAIYAAKSGSIELPAITAWTVSAETPPAALQNLPRHTIAIDLDGPLTFVGARSKQTKQTLTSFCLMDQKL